jgi:indole-3-glycerol phosphate synthase
MSIEHSNIGDLFGNTVATGTILDRIVAKKAGRIEARLEHRTVEELAEKAFASPLPRYNFAKAIRGQGLSVIAEVKRPLRRRASSRRIFIRAAKPHVTSRAEPPRSRS